MRVIATYKPEGKTNTPGLVPGEQYLVQCQRWNNDVAKVKLVGVNGMFDSSLFNFSYPNGIPLDANDVDVEFEHLKEAISVMLAAGVIRAKHVHTANGLATIRIASAAFVIPLFYMRISDIDWLISPKEAVATGLAAAVTFGELSFREFNEEDVSDDNYRH